MDINLNKYFDLHKELQYSLKSYRDLKNVIDTSYDEGKIDGIIEGEIKGIAKGIVEGEMNVKVKGIINALKNGKWTIEEIAEVFDVTVEFVLEIKKEYNL
jgi:plasmid maintenance system antidote protein VapI